MGLITSSAQWSDAAWADALFELPPALKDPGVRVLASVLDNTPAALALDDWARAHGWVHVPLPLFFTPAQMRHAVALAGVDTLVVLPALLPVWPEATAQPSSVLGEDLCVLRLTTAPVSMPQSTQTITFTSGTTGAPKGVCLGESAMNTVAQALAQAMAPLGIQRHLNALPFAVLLEHVAGVRAARAAGADIITLPLAELGWQGASGFDVTLFHQAVLRHPPHSVVLLPQMLRAWCALLATGAVPPPTSLRMVAVGGASVGAPLVLAAQALGLPVLEGYGLSEGASVQCLNLPGASRAGSVGRPLPHVRLRLANDGELWVQGSLMLGYLGDESAMPTEWPTGDLARIDLDGFVFIEGRKKNVLITSFGRNVSPEWVETVVRASPVVREVVVLGDGQAQLSAVIWPMSEAVSDALIEAAVQAANTHLPDYAQLCQWVRAEHTFGPDTGMSTTNGRPQRSAILRAHAHALGFSSSLSEVTP